MAIEAATVPAGSISIGGVTGECRNTEAIAVNTATLARGGVLDGGVTGHRHSARLAVVIEAAAVAGRAADILALPGVLKQVVNDELNPLLGKPQPLTPDLAAQAAAKLRLLSAACRRAAS